MGSAWRQLSEGIARRAPRGEGRPKRGSAGACGFQERRGCEAVPEGSRAGRDGIHDPRTPVLRISPFRECHKLLWRAAGRVALCTVIVISMLIGMKQTPVSDNVISPQKPGLSLSAENVSVLHSTVKPEITFPFFQILDFRCIKSVVKTLCEPVSSFRVWGINLTGGDNSIAKNIREPFVSNFWQIMPANNSSEYFIDDRRRFAIILNNVVYSWLLIRSKSIKDLGIVRRHLDEKISTLQCWKCFRAIPCRRHEIFSDYSLAASYNSQYDCEYCYKYCGNRRDRAVMLIKESAGHGDDRSKPSQQSNFLAGLIVIIGGIIALVWGAWCIRPIGTSRGGSKWR